MKGKSPELVQKCVTWLGLVLLMASGFVWVQRTWGPMPGPLEPLKAQNLERTENGVAIFDAPAIAGWEGCSNVIVMEGEKRLPGPARGIKGLLAEPEGGFVVRGRRLWIKSSDSTLPNSNARVYLLAVPKPIADRVAYPLYTALLLSFATVLWMQRGRVKAEGLSLRQAAPVPEIAGDVAAASARTKTNRVAFLDGIRGWASVMVLLNHITLPARSLQTGFLAFPRDGNLAVAVFFVLSGFALSTQYFQTGDRRVITQLALRRYPRLAIPILAACTCAYLLLRFGLFWHHEVAKMMGGFQWLDDLYGFDPSFIDMLKYSLFDAFFVVMPYQPYDFVLWTMQIEFMGSMVVFGLAAVTGHLRYRLGILLLVCAVFLLMGSWYLAFPLGMILALYHCRPLWRGTVAPWLCLPALVWAVFYSTATSGLVSWQGPDRTITATILTATALVLAVLCSDKLRAFFSNRVSTYLGSVSFPLYLTHLLVLCSWESWLWIKLPQWGMGLAAAQWVTLSSTLLICFGVAHLFRGVERLAIKGARQVSEVLGRTGAKEAVPPSAASANDGGTVDTPPDWLLIRRNGEER